MSIDPRFWDKIARKYAATPIKNMEGYNKTLDRARHYLSPESHALEIGCGTGSTALILAKHVKSYQAADISSEMIAIANEKLLKDPRENLVFLQSSLEDVSVSNRTLDVVLAFSLLHLVEDLNGTLAQMRSRLKPGGLVISKTPCMKGGLMTGLFKVLIAVMKLFGKAPGTVLLFSKDELCKAFINSGFEIIEQSDDHGSSLTRFIVARKV